MADKIRVDIVSDVVCPWCYIGYKKLEQALEIAGLEGEVVWHPFELNAAMPAEGANVIDYLMSKGMTREQLTANRANLNRLGEEVGIDFSGRSPLLLNTNKAHQLLTWAYEQGGQTTLKLKLFEAYFERGLNISDETVLLDLVEAANLDRGAAAEALEQGRYAQSVQAEAVQWRDMGITSVPSMIFEGKALVMGAQEPERLAQAMRKMVAETKAAAEGAEDSDDAAA